MADIEVLLHDFQKIRLRIANSEIEEALQELAALMPQTGLEMEDEVLALQQQMSHTRQQIRLNLIENGEYARRLNSISYAVLQVITTACKHLRQQQARAVPSTGISVTEPAAETGALLSADLPAALREGLQKMDEGNYSSALQLFSAHLQTDPRSWKAMHYLGSLHEALGLWEEAVHWYSEALKVNPANAVAINNRGNIRMEQLGEYEKALKDFSTALIADPGLNTARYNRALSLMYLSRYEPAVDDLSRCIQEGFMSPTAHGLRGVCLAAIGRHAEAAEDLRVALRAEPENATYWATYGLCEYHHGLYAQAIQTLDHALSLNPHQPEMQHVRGMAYFFLNDYDAAQADFEDVTRQKPDYAYGWYFLGLCKKMKGFAAEATQYLTESLRQNPQLAEAYAVLGVIAYEQNRMDDAIRLCEQALSLNAELPVAREFLQKAQQAKKSGGLWTKLFGG